MPHGESVTKEEATARIKQLADELGHIPTRQQARDSGLNRWYIDRIWGTYSSMRAEVFGQENRQYRYGGNYKDDYREYLLQLFRDFYAREGRPVMTAEVTTANGLANRSTYQRYFGTLNAARLEAGMKAVVATPNNKDHKYIELDAEQYALYRQGGHKALEAGVVTKRTLSKRKFDARRRLQQRQERKK